MGAGWLRGGTGIEKQSESFLHTAKSLLSLSLCSGEGSGNVKKANMCLMEKNKADGPGRDDQERPCHEPRLS